jgi:4-hydroxybenzoate polyprenyltransferase
MDASQQLPRAVLSAARTYGRMVRIEHSLFALPFALAGVSLGAFANHLDGRPALTAWKLVWVIVAMVGVRNAAMGFNRLVDHHLDAENPRTAGRELPTGRLARGPVWGFTLLLSGLFVLAAGMLGPLCLALSPVALLIVFGYSFAKRFTWTTQLWLGVALAVAPVGGWLAVRGSFGAAPWVVAGAVALWAAGFDTLYACQDVHFDRSRGLGSLPARFGAARALTLARVAHVAGVGLLALVPSILPLHPAYFAGVAVIAGLLAWEHRLVRPDDLSRAGVAFFHLNAVVSAVYLAAVLAGVLLADTGAMA